MNFANNYSEINKQKPQSFRNILRSLALDGLSLMDNLRNSDNYLKKKRIQFLYIHHVFKDEEESLIKLIERLAQHHHFISYSEAVIRILEGNIDKPYICLSSDDGFKNNLRAAEILKRFDIKACFFINPGLIGETSYNKIKEHCRKHLNLPPIEFLNWAEVEKLQQMGHEIGSHTMSHINIAKTKPSLFEDDCKLTYEIIQSRCGTVKHFSFPYGRFFHFNEIGRKIVFNAGFTSCASAERGCHINAPEKIEMDKLCILRDHVVLNWNMGHVLHFIINNSKKAKPENNYFPYPTT